MEDIKDARRILKTRFITDVKRQGQHEIARAIEQVLPLLNARNTEVARGKQVTDLSSRVKSEAEVTPGAPLFITTIFPEWYVKGREGKILEEQAEKGPVYVMISEGLRYPPDHIVRDMRRRGLIVAPIPPGIISTNISKEKVTLYRSPSPSTPHDSHDRVAIHIRDEPGKALANSFRNARPLWAPDHYTLFGPPFREFAILRAIDSILENTKERKILESAIRNDHVPPPLRILLGLYVLQNEKDQLYKMEEIAEKVGLKFSKVKAEVDRWRLQQTADLGRFEFSPISEKQGVESIRLVPEATIQVIPLTLTMTIQYLYIRNDDIQRLVDKYHLPPIHRTNKLLETLR